MELKHHMLVLSALVVYTLVLVLLVSRNIRALRTHHACSDVSTPLCKAVASLLESGGATPAAIFRAFGEANFHAVRLLVFDEPGNVLFDSQDDGSGIGAGGSGAGASTTVKPRPPTESQKDAKHAFDTSAPTRLVHRPSGTVMAHVCGAKVPSTNGLVLTEVLAV